MILVPIDAGEAFLSFCYLDDLQVDPPCFEEDMFRVTFPSPIRLVNGGVPGDFLFLDAFELQALRGNPVRHGKRFDGVVAEVE